MSRLLRGAALVIAAAAVLPADALAKEDPADAAEVLAAASPAERLKQAEELEGKDVDAVAAALIALGGRKVKKGDDVTPDLEFLAEYVVVQKGRALRLLAIDAGARLGQEAFAERLRAKADGEDRLRSALAAEALGMVGGKDDVPRLLELGRSTSISIAVRAVRSVARIGTKKDADALMEIALDHEDPEVGDHAAWASQDLLKTQKAMLGKMKKLIGKDPGAPRALRYASLEAMLQDHLEPFAWKDDALEKARELLGAAPREIVINCSDDDRRKRIQESVDWLKENLPVHHLLVRAAIASIDVPGPNPNDHLSTDKNLVCVPLSYTVQTPRQLAYHIVRAATVVFECRIGHPYVGHRGWENAIFDTYDVCEAAGLYSAGKGGLNRDQFLLEIISKRPWGGN